MFSRIFLSPDEPRLRAGWRLAIQSLLALALLFAFSLPVAVGLMLTQVQVAQTRWAYLLLNIPPLLGILASVWVARRHIDLRTFGSLGLQVGRQAGPGLAIGVAIAAAMMGLILLLELAVGWTRIEAWAWESAPLDQVALELLAALLFFIAIGFEEEILYRGYQLQNIKGGTNLLCGVILSSAIFAIVHVANPNSKGYATVLGLFLAGIFLAYGWVRTRQLWLPIGLHIGWNLFEGPIFGFPVSGLDTTRLLVHSVNGPDLWTGGAFGPEAGLIILPAMALGALLIWACTRGRQPSPADPPPPQP